MDWAQHKKRIRRFLRDPGANIWSDEFLRNVFNSEQTAFSFLFHPEDVQIIRIPPMYQFSYMHDWEWRFTQHDNGHVYRVGGDYDQSGVVSTSKWEATHIAGFSSPTSDVGVFYVHPWEAWTVSTPSEPPPIWSGERSSDIIFLSHDRKPIFPTSKKFLQERDTVWRTRGGQPMEYWKDEDTDNHIRIYPRPDNVSWYDVSPDGVVLTTSDEETGSGVLNFGESQITFGVVEVYFGSGGEGSGNTGTIIDYTGAMSSSDHGVALDILLQNSNLLSVYKKLPVNVDADTDETIYPKYLTKYIEYGVLEKAYRANTDGKIKSLAEYWGKRRSLSERIVGLFKSHRRSDRVFRMRTKGAPISKNYRHARLPDGYPAVFP